MFRLITANAFVGPSAKTQRPLLKAVLPMLLALLAAVIISVLMKNVSSVSPGQIDEMSATLLFNTAVVVIIIAAIKFIINRIQNRDDE